MKNTIAIVPEDFDLDTMDVQTSCEWKFSITGDSGCSSAASVTKTAEGKNYNLNLNPTAVALNLNCNILSTKIADSPSSKEDYIDRVIPFKVNVAVTCTA